MSARLVTTRIHEFEGFEGGEPISSPSATLCSKSSPSSITSTPARRRFPSPRAGGGTLSRWP